MAKGRAASPASNMAFVRTRLRDAAPVVAARGFVPAAPSSVTPPVVPAGPVARSPGIASQLVAIPAAEIAREAATETTTTYRPPVSLPTGVQVTPSDASEANPGATLRDQLAAATSSAGADGDAAGATFGALEQANAERFNPASDPRYVPRAPTDVDTRAEAQGGADDAGADGAAKSSNLLPLAALAALALKG